MGFKKGDRVRRIKEIFTSGKVKLEVGDTDVVIDVVSGWMKLEKACPNDYSAAVNFFELVKSKSTKFEIGDTVEMIEDYSYAKIGMIGIIRSKIRGINNQCQVEFEKEFEGGHSCDGSIESNRGHNLSFESIKLVSKEKLIEKKMELDVKKIDKSILAEANKEVLTEIANEQKEIAKKKLRELYDRKKVAENNAKEVGDELKEITKDLKDLVKSK